MSKLVLGDFSLDSRLKNDTVFLKDLNLSRLLIMNDSRYPWLILVPRVSFNITELFELTDEQFSELHQV